MAFPEAPPLLQKGQNLCADYARYLTDVSVLILRSIRTDFCTQSLPPVDHQLPSFVANLFRQSKVSYSVLLAGLLYLLRFRHALLTKGPREAASRSKSMMDPRHPLFTFVVFVVALLLASKFLNDRHSSNGIWAETTGLSMGDLNRGEIFFLNVIDHRLHMENEVFQRWLTYLFQPHHLHNYLWTGQHSSQWPINAFAPAVVNSANNRQLSAYQHQRGSCKTLKNPSYFAFQGPGSNRKDNNILGATTKNETDENDSSNNRKKRAYISV